MRYSYPTAISLVLAATFAVLASCKAMPPEPPSVIFPPYDGGLGSGGADAEVRVDPLCAVACENLAKIGCPESVPAGRSCGSTCTMASANGFDLRLYCLATASLPEHVRGCCPAGQPCTQVRCMIH